MTFAIKPTRFYFFPILAALLMLTGCGSARRGEPVAPPLSASSSTVARGETIFMHACHQCHPKGEAGLGPALNNKPLPAFMIRFQVRHGLGAMPAFSEKDLSDRDLDRVIAYLKALRKNG